MNNNAAKFTIFLPVKNGGVYLPICVRNILAQTYQGFELVILENQSTDGTTEWLQTLEREDSRVRVIPSKSALSIEDNWDRILYVPKKEFMTVIGHDDLLEPEFLEEINTQIQHEPEASLYLTHFMLIDGEGKFIRYCKPIPKYETAVDFLAARMAVIRDSFGTGYVMRSEHYDKFGGIPHYNNLLYADDALWLLLMGKGFKITSSRVCFSYRQHSASASGKPTPEPSFNGMKKYLNLLSILSKENHRLDGAMKLYVPSFVENQIQDYYRYLLKVTPWGQKIDQERILELELILKEFAAEKKLDKSYAGYKKHLCRSLIAWVRRKLIV